VAEIGVVLLDGSRWPVVVDDAAQSLSQATFETDASNAVLTFRVPWDEREEAVLYFCDTAETVREQLISRKPSPRHPAHDWLRASRVSLRGESPNGKEQLFNGQFIDRYENILFTVLYQPTKYDVVEDGIVESEWQRYTERSKITATVEYVNTGPGAFKFVTGAYAVAGLDRLKLAKSIPLRRIGFVWVWRRVPETYLLNEDRLPLRIMAGLGTVNKTAFAGIQPERLYFSHVDIDDELAMISPLELSLFNHDFKRSPLLYKVTFTFLYDPFTWQTTLDPSGSRERIGYVYNPTVGPFPTSEFEELFLISR
jgi:hypothetical protein